MGVKDPCTACCLVWFCGVCGVHRCYLDDVCCGCLYFLTGGCFLFGAILDCCYIGTMTQAANCKYLGGGVSVTVANNNLSNVIIPPPSALQAMPVAPFYPPTAQQVMPSAYYPPQPGYPPQHPPQPGFPPQAQPAYPPQAQPVVAGAAESYGELTDGADGLLAKGASSPGAFCSSCGARKAAGAKFCSSCGGQS